MVYVDDMRAPFEGTVVCHMLADTSEELHAMADRLGIPRTWVQFPGTAKEHYDITWDHRSQAIACGAMSIAWRDTGRLVNAKCRR